MITCRTETDEKLGVFMARIVKHLVGEAGFHHLTPAHDHHAVSKIRTTARS